MKKQQISIILDENGQEILANYLELGYEYISHVSGWNRCPPIAILQEQVKEKKEKKEESIKEGDFVLIEFFYEIPSPVPPFDTVTGILTKWDNMEEPICYIDHTEIFLTGEGFTSKMQKLN